MKPLRERLRLAFELLAALPLRPPGVPLAALVIDLGVSERALYRLIADLRRAGVAIETSAIGSGPCGYFVGAESHPLLVKLGFVE
jgi:predicted DNA-binding transcriptional regulator YafY